MKRVGVLVAGALVATALLASGCGTEPSDTPPPAAQGATQPPAPTAPVGVDGQPVTDLCQVLSEQEISKILGVEAKAPAANDASATSATCTYGDAMTLTIAVLPSTEDAAKNLQSALQSGPYDSKKSDVQAGVDESVYGTAKDSFGITVRREKLVFSIVASGTPDGGEPKMIQLAGLVLSRINALGT